jgi:hypothetical protein
MGESIVRKVLEQFNKEYDFMYEHERTAYVAGYDEALEYGDRLIAERHPIVASLCKMRGDIFSSDREVAALGFAVSEILG